MLDKVRDLPVDAFHTAERIGSTLSKRPPASAYRITR